MCLRKNNPKKSKNILLSMAKISKNTKNQSSKVRPSSSLINLTALGVSTFA